MGWLTKFLGPPSEQRAIEKLKSLALVTAGTSALPNRTTMLRTIQKIERKYEPNMSPALADVLAGAIVCFVGWHVRGKERKPFLERAVHYYRRSGNKEQLGCLLVKEAQVRDLKEAIALLEDVFRESKTYRPSLCFYADALYKDGQSLEAYEAAIKIHRMAELHVADSKRKFARDSISAAANEGLILSVPTGPMDIAAKALRAEAKLLSKEGEIEAALAVLDRLQATGRATENDAKIMERLQQKSK